MQEVEGVEMVQNPAFEATGEGSKAAMNRSMINNRTGRTGSVTAGGAAAEDPDVPKSKLGLDTLRFTSGCFASGLSVSLSQCKLPH